MGTHDEANKAEPQNEFLSGFKIMNKEEKSLNNSGKNNFQPLPNNFE